jgi:hypothetical protein
MTSTRTYVARRKMRIFFTAAKKYLHTSVLYGTREQKFSQCSPGLSEGAGEGAAKRSTYVHDVVPQHRMKPEAPQNILYGHNNNNNNIYIVLLLC